MPKLTIRSATLSDSTQVTELWRNCGLVTSYNNPARDFQFAKEGGSSDVLVGEHESGQIIASIMVGNDGHRGWLYYVAIDPHFQGGGFGRQIIEAGQEWLRNKGVVKVQLLVRETNTKVVSFYEHLGFEVAPRTVLTKWLKV